MAIDNSDNTGSYDSYTVKSTDTLASIAIKFKTSVAMLIYINGLESTSISVNQTLSVPSVNDNVAATSSSAIATAVSSTRGVTVSHPYASVTISTETGILTLNQNLAITSVNFEGDILSIRTIRDIGQDCPTFTLSVVYRNDWYSKIGSNDLVIIALCRPPETKANVLVGLVDDIRKTTDYSSGKPTRAFNVTGRGFNKALLMFNIGAISELSVASSTQGFMIDQVSTFSNGCPSDIISEVLRVYIGKGCDYNFANKQKFTSYYQASLKDNSKNYEFLSDTSSFLSYQGSLWEFIKELKNAPFNELFWEIVNDRPTLVFRPTPFNKAEWDKLPKITVKDLDIVSENLGRSDLETYTMYKVKSETFSGDTDELGVLPLWYPPYYSKYGIIRLEVTSKYINYVATDTSDTQETNLINKMKDLFNWNIKNNSMENGTLAVKGSNRYKVGSRLQIESTGIEYYIENVTQAYTLYSGWQTTLSLTRGLLYKNRFTAPWGSSVQMTASDVSKIFGYDVSSVQTDVTRGSTGVDTSSDVIDSSITGVTQKAILDTALGQQGSNMGDGSASKYAQWYYGSKHDGYSWCAIFVSWCANQAGISTNVIPKYASCDDGLSWFKKQGRFQASSSYSGAKYFNPKAGDIIFFSDNHTMLDSTHTGIVMSSNSTTVYTIEGNTSNTVAKRHYLLSSSYILGYGVPGY